VKRLRLAGAGTALALFVAMSGLQLALAQPAPLSGEAWSLADEAYKAYDARDFARAADKAREAVALRPDLAQLRRLLINTLAAQGDISGALAAAEQAVADSVSDAELLSLRDSLKQQSAARPATSAPDAGYLAADAGYRAYARRDYAAAIANARKALGHDPSRENYHSLLVDALRGAGRAAEAERAASAALARFPSSPVLHLQRGYLRQRLKLNDGAIADFTVALRSSQLTPAQRRSARLSLVDALLAARRPQQALAALGPLGRGYEPSIRRGFALQALDRQDDALAAFDEAAAQAGNRSQRSTAERGAISALAALNRMQEARVRFNTAYGAGLLQGMSALDTAYLANQVGEYAISYAFLQRADAQGQLGGNGLLDAAYAARRAFDNTAAESYFRRAIDLHHEGALPLDPQRLFEIRRDVANLTRTWGATASVIHGAVGVMPGVPLTVPSGAQTWQAGAEIYWRPPNIGFRDGATFELFTRAFQTLADQTGGPTGASTTQGSAGARWKPFANVNLVLEIGRLFRIGQASREDWQARVGYSVGEGGDLRFDVDHWRYWQIYGEASRFLESGQTLASAEARFGHAFRVGGQPNLVFTPFVSAGAAYDSTLATPEAFGIGAGANLRLWFREDRYTAPMSYFDLTVQYRARVAGDRRAQGAFAVISLNY